MNVRIFFSSPGDVTMERETAKRIVDRLQSEIGTTASLQPYFWEHEVMVATKDYQENIPHMDDFDIVVCILWSRLGTPLDPARHPKPGGGGFKSGTEYEFFTAMKAHELKGTPDIFVFRNSTEPRRPSRPREVREKVDREIDRLDDFFDTYFQDEQFFTRAINIYSTLGEFEEKLTIALRSYLTGRLPNAASAGEKKYRPKYDRQPYLGLSAFDYQDAPVFFGRTAEVGDIIAAYQAQEMESAAFADAPPKHFVLILGSSGSGKSSLARAGVLPMLTNPGVIEGANAWRTAIFKPADVPGDPILALVQSLSMEHALPELFADGTKPLEIANLIRTQPQGGGLLLRQALTQAGALALTKQRHDLTAKLETLVAGNRPEDAKALREKIENLTAPSVRIALLADQLEELFTSDLSPDTLANFIGILIALANSGRVFVLATLRSDFYPRCLEHPDLIALMQGNGTYALPAPSAADIGQMIRQPAAIAGLTFEENTTTGEKLDELLRDAALKDPAALPLLSYTLEQLHEQRSDQGLLTLRAYEELGGLEGAIGSRAETVFTSLPSDAQDAFDGLCKQLVTLQEGGEPTRRRAQYTTLTRTPQAKNLLDSLVNARLLTADTTPSAERVISVAHEALLRHWPRLVSWVEENRLFLNTRTRVASRMADWIEKSKADDYLLPRGPGLSAAESILTGHLASLDPMEIEFIGKSTDRVRREDQRKLRNARLITMGAVVLCLVAVAGGLFAMASKRTAQKERNAAIKQEKLAKAASEKAVASEARTSYLLGINQLESGKIREGMISLGQTLTIDPNHPGALARLYSEHLYSLPKAIPIRSFHANIPPNTRQRISGAQQGPRQYMAYISDKKHPALLDLNTLETVPGPWEKEPDSYAPVLSEDSGCLANIRMDLTTQIWNVAAGTSSVALTASKNFSQLGFTPDGKLFIDCDQSGQVKIIDTASGEAIHAWKLKSPCNWLCVSENRFITITSIDELTIYDRETNSHKKVEMPATEAEFISCRAAREGTVVILHTRKSSADGERWENVFKFIDSSAATLIEGARTLEFTSSVWDISLNHDGSKVAVALHDANPEIRHITDSALDATFDLRGTHATKISFSPDDRLLVVSDPIGTVNIFANETRKPVFHPIRHPGRLEELLISWDGRYLLTSTIKIATVWDLAVGSALPLPISYNPNAGISKIFNNKLRIHLNRSIDCLDLNTLESKIEVRLPNPDIGKLLSEDLSVCATYMPDKSVEFHSIASEPPAKLSSWKSSGGSVNYWELSKDGSTFAGTDEKNIIHFADTFSGKSISSVEIPNLSVGELLFTPDGNYMIVASNLSDKVFSRIFIIDVRSGKKIDSRFEDIATPILRVSDNSRYIAISGHLRDKPYSQQIIIWDTENISKSPASIEHPYPIKDFRFSPDSSLIALAGEDMVAKVFATSSFQEVAEPIITIKNPFLLLAFSKDSSMLATAANAENADIRVWDWRNAKQISVPFNLPIFPSAMHFSEGGTKLVAVRANSLEDTSKGCIINTFEIMPRKDISKEILPLAEAITGYNIRQGELPKPVDPLKIWDVLRKEYPNTWFLNDPARRSISPDFSTPSVKWMEDQNVGIEALLSAMPAVSIANASISHWEQVSLGNRRKALSKLEPGSTDHEEMSAGIAASEARIAQLISFAERNARTDPAVCYHLAQQARQAENIDRAIEYCRKAIALDANHEDSLHLLAIIFQDQKKLRDSILLFRKLKDLSPDRAVYRLRLGISLHSIGEEKEAISLLEGIVGSTELDADDRALSLVILGRSDEALPLFKRAAEDQKSRSADSEYSNESLVYLITAYHRTGNTAEAIAHYRMFIAAERQAASRTAIESLGVNRIYMDSLLSTLKDTLAQHPELAPKDNE